MLTTGASRGAGGVGRRAPQEDVAAPGIDHGKRGDGGGQEGQVSPRRDQEEPAGAGRRLGQTRAVRQVDEGEGAPGVEEEARPIRAQGYDLVARSGLPGGAPGELAGRGHEVSAERRD